MKEKYFVVANSISKWKVDNVVENCLAHFADDSAFWKHIYVLFYKFVSPKYYMKGVELAKAEICRQWESIDDEVKEHFNVNALVLDMIYCLHRFGTSFEEYFVFKYYERNTFGRSRFNNIKRQYGFCQLVNGKNVRELFEDKGALYNKLKKYYKRDLVVVYNENQKDELLSFLFKHNSFIFKPLKGHSGSGIKIYHTCTSPQVFYEDNIKNGPFVLEELIEQGEDMAKLHRESINTVRLVTFKIKDKVHIVGGTLRMGVGNSNVDNAGAGGIYASIDLENGFVCSMACDNRNHVFSKHPTTGCKIVGFDLPQWSNALSLVKEMALNCGGATIIAWDLAYSTKGWLVIEGNDVGEPYLLQAPLQIGVISKVTSLLDLYFKK